MENYIYEGEEESEGPKSEEDPELEEGFTEGYTKDEEVLECAECGTAVREERKVVKEIDGEEYVFCSKACVKDFMESMKQ